MVSFPRGVTWCGASGQGRDTSTQKQVSLKPLTRTCMATLPATSTKACSSIVQVGKVKGGGGWRGVKGRVKGEGCERCVKRKQAVAVFLSQALPRALRTDPVNFCYLSIRRKQHSGKTLSNNVHRRPVCFFRAKSFIKRGKYLEKST